MSGQALPEGEFGGFAPVGDGEFSEDIGNVEPGRLGADEELVSDLAVGAAMNQQAQNLDLASGQAVPGRRTAGSRPFGAASRLSRNAGPHFAHWGEGCL